MSERQKVAEMTKTLVNMFPDSKNDLEKEKYYYDPFDDNKWTNRKWEISLFTVLDARNKQIQQTF